MGEKVDQLVTQWIPMQTVYISYQWWARTHFKVTELNKCLPSDISPSFTTKSGVGG